MSRLFRRTGCVTVRASGETCTRRGVIYALGKYAQDFSTPELERYGSLETPLYRYFGDAGELLNSPGATVSSEMGTFAVLECMPVAGPRGQTYIQAILERQAETDDGK